MNRDQQDIEFDEAVMLIDSYFERTITDEQSNRLLELLGRSKSLQDYFVAESRTDFFLRAINEGLPPDSMPPDMDELARLAAESPSLPRAEHMINPRKEAAVQKKYDILPFKPLSPKERWRSAVLFVIVMAMITTAVYFEFRPISSESASSFIALAEVTESIDAVWENDAVYKKGRELGLEKLNLLEGVVQLRLKNNVEIVLEGPTEFVLRGDDETFCRAGKISATVPPEGKGFKIATPVATVIDLGTEFSLSVDDEKIDVHVVKGTVDVARSGSDRLQLTTGLAAMLDFKGVTRQYETDIASFFSRETVRKIWSDYMQRRRAVWEEEERRRSQDPSLLVSLADVRAHGCRQVEGSRPDRTAFRFQSQRDCLDVSMPGEHADLTLVTHVRIRDMKNFSNTLCLGSGFLHNDGEFAWQLDNNGVLRFQVQSNGIQRYDSGVAVSRKDWNTWVQLAVVADAKNGEIRHYVDGRRIAALPWRTPSPLKMPSGAIGNAPPEQRKRSLRFWSGDIDSFYAFSRTFSDAEIAEMYENLR